MRVQTMAEAGALIRGARQETGLTQVELARRARVSREWLIKVESGHTSAELPRILAVLAELGLTAIQYLIRVVSGWFLFLSAGAVGRGGLTRTRW